MDSLPALATQICGGGTQREGDRTLTEGLSPASRQAVSSEGLKSGRIHVAEMEPNSNPSPNPNPNPNLK